MVVSVVKTCRGQIRTVIIHQSCLDVFTSRAYKPDVPDVSPLSVDFLEPPDLAEAPPCWSDSTIR